ncbi:hypothetical protein M0R72_16775 [Candidatus Pacearchaeota archaeon]|jgi:hypothetical protein|nr:hypothetical protein [Candidatus Pacearchaeota archaeon]
MTIDEMFQIRNSKGLVDLAKLRDAIKTLGKPVKGVTPQQRRALQQQARKMLVAVYGKKEMSLREFESAVSSAVYKASPDGQQYSAPPSVDYWYVCDIYPEEGYAVAEIGNIHRYLKIPFTVENKMVVLADPDMWVEVERRWMEVSND